MLALVLVIPVRFILHNFISNMCNITKKIIHTVGAFVGASVGDCVGAFVGFAVGESVGVFVGELVGANVGLSVGDMVGES